MQAQSLSSPAAPMPAVQPLSGPTGQASPPLRTAALPLSYFGEGRPNPGADRERRGPGRLLHALVVEDDPPVRHACSEIAASLGYQVLTADSVPAARLHLAADRPDLVLLDLRLPGGTGTALLDEIRSEYPGASIIVMTAFGTVHSAVDLMRKGATDFLAKPFALEDLSTVLERVAEGRHWSEVNRRLQDRLRSGKSVGMLVGQSPAMEKLTRIVSKVAFTRHPVLILGESGAGKEDVGRAIHSNGTNPLSPFVPIDCACLAPSRLEGELFGCSTDAMPVPVGRQRGLLSSAGEGTVFLDEVGELTPDLQSKLVRLLRDKLIRPVGSAESYPLKARILASSSRDLVTMVGNGRFRKDLFYQLNVVNIRVPPLRERGDDIPLLAAQTLARLSRERGTTYAFSEETVRLLMEYAWPGNLRELETVIERACALSSGPVLHLADFPTQLQNFERDSRECEVETESALALREAEPLAVLTLQELEKQAIINTLRQLQGDKIQAARLLGIGKTTLYRKLKEYGIPDDTE